MELTNETILDDIILFKDRIRQIKLKLNDLPVSAPNWKQTKKLREQRRMLKDDIRHVRNLIRIAETALE